MTNKIYIAEGAAHCGVEEHSQVGEPAPTLCTDEADAKIEARLAG